MRALLVISGLVIVALVIVLLFEVTSDREFRAEIAGLNAGIDELRELTSKLTLDLASVKGLLELRSAERRADRSKEEEVHAEVTAILEALERYLLDEGMLPGFGEGPDPRRNDFPLLWVALMDRPRPVGRGGRNAPYLAGIDEDRVCVAEGGGYRKATALERGNNTIPKYLVDRWKQRYVYRCNKAIGRHSYMRRPDYDLYSLGPNGVDDTARGKTGKENDDIHGCR